MDHVWMVLSLIMAVKSSNLHWYKHCLFKMCDLFFPYDGQNYARYLTFFARSSIPWNRCAVDKSNEETFMKNAKSRGGMGSGSTVLSGITTNYNSYKR